MTEPVETRMSFWSHLNELRKRIVYTLLGVAIGFGIAYHFAERIFDLLLIPYRHAYQTALHSQPVMITTGLVESFMVYMKVGLYGGIFLASPVILWQIWSFIAPGLHPHERKHALTIVALASFFFIGGSLFGYFFVFPVGFTYFLEINGGGQIQPMIKMSEYFELSSTMLLIFGCVFEAPLLVMVLVVLGVLQAKHLTKPWRGIIVSIAVAAALFSPPDAGSMIMVGIPMLILYGITVVFSLLFQRRTPP